MSRLVIDTSALFVRRSRCILEQADTRGFSVEVPALVLAERVRQLVRDKPGTKPEELFQEQVQTILLYGQVIPFDPKQALSLGIQWWSRISRMIQVGNFSKSPGNVAREPPLSGRKGERHG